MIDVEGLTKQYGQVRAVDDLTFSVKPGIVTGFLGPNGAGKSTTMRMILGLDRPTAGTATIGGKRYRDLKNPVTEVGALLDAKAVHPNRSAANHLKWLAQSNGLPARRVDEVLGLVGLTEVAGKKAGGFSLGMGQRLGLAGALLGDPQVLILDEPVNGLDPEGIRWVRGLLKALADEGRTVLVSSHLLSEMAMTADHLIVIGRGRLVADTSTYEFIKQHSASTVVVRSGHHDEFLSALREENIDFHVGTDPEGRATIEIPERSTDEIGALAFSTGVLLSELSLRRASLEDAFMEMTGDAVQYHGTTAATTQPGVEKPRTEEKQP
ncbi:ABC transporter ATP-binding protein [Corynebacterium halotolerans]|uniref:ABC transporter ATP-binding protein n=1 Tax=Corynebacterium halotolerans YIM 70093 = DSM 44683 TaxID=1121362 RepID=M1NQ52_9CORY|nr:ABC transporter ATP-binding protein [Corynebacterium halotolerans]AGF73493.1 ABC transporter ATP-binding protein [Corynebacterium halotolerans YIM 70093 = DSM 44683]